MEESDPCAGKLFSSTEKMTAPALYRSNFTPSTSFTLRPAMAIRTSSGSRKYSVPWVVSVRADSRGVTSPKSTTSGASARDHEVGRLDVLVPEALLVEAL